MNRTGYLPPDLCGPTTTITRINAGLSGAGVYRVEAAGQLLVLKVAAESESAVDWLRTLHIQQLAARAGLAPRIVQVEEARRAVVTVSVADLSFAAFYRDPLTHEAALTQLGRTVRRIHVLPLAEKVCQCEPRDCNAEVPGKLIDSNCEAALSSSGEIELGSLRHRPSKTLVNS